MGNLAYCGLEPYDVLFGWNLYVVVGKFVNLDNSLLQTKKKIRMGGSFSLLQNAFLTCCVPRTFSESNLK